MNEVTIAKLWNVRCHPVTNTEDSFIETLIIHKL